MTWRQRLASVHTSALLRGVLHALFGDQCWPQKEYLNRAREGSCSTSCGEAGNPKSRRERLGVEVHAPREVLRAPAASQNHTPRLLGRQTLCWERF